MKTKKLGYLVVPVALAFAALILMLSLLSVSSASAQARTEIEEKPYSIEEPVIYYTVPLTDPDLVFDPFGNLIGEGIHTGKMVCSSNNCRGKTELYFPPQIDSANYEYKFSSLLTRDPVERRAVVGGTGKITEAGKKVRFSFTATFTDNRDGTVSVEYHASLPEASFIIPQSAGQIKFQR